VLRAELRFGASGALISPAVGVGLRTVFYEVVAGSGLALERVDWTFTVADPGFAVLIFPARISVGTDGALASTAVDAGLAGRQLLVRARWQHANAQRAFLVRTAVLVLEAFNAVTLAVAKSVGVVVVAALPLLHGVDGHVVGARVDGAFVAVIEGIVARHDRRIAVFADDLLAVAGLLT